MIKSGLCILLFCALFVHTQWLYAQPSQPVRDSRVDYGALTFGPGIGTFIVPTEAIIGIRLGTHVGYISGLLIPDLHVRVLLGLSYMVHSPRHGNEMYELDVTGHYDIVRGKPGLTAYAGVSILGFSDGQISIDYGRGYYANTRTLKRKLNAVVGFGVPFGRTGVELSLHVSMFATRPHYFTDDYSYEHKFFELKVLYDLPL